MPRFDGARQNTRAAEANLPPGFIPKGSKSAEATASPGFKSISPQDAAATMHDDLSDDAKKLANGSRNVPIHPAQVATEGSDKQGWGGDAAQHDPTGQGFGT